MEGFKKAAVGKETAMDDKSIKVRVSLGLLADELLVLDGFTSSNTVKMVKNRLFEQVKNIDLGIPDYGLMLSPEGHPMEDKVTLQSLLDLGYGDWSTYLLYIPGDEPPEIPKEPKMNINWLSLCECVRLREEAHKGNIDNPVSRPKTIQSAQLSALCIHGQYELLDSNNSHIHDVSRIRLTASASVILLAPNHEILKGLISLNDKSNYLVVLVTWNKLSYLFLRTLRSSYPDIPIVAVTDLDPHHLDLLTFLDTPLENLPCCYGWDLRGECTDESNTIGFLNISWLGLRPADCEGHLCFDGASRYPPGFREVIRMLRVNPFIRRKKHWLAALDWFDVFGKSVTFHPLAPADPPSDCHLFLGDSFVAKKLSKKDWV